MIVGIDVDSQYPTNPVARALEVIGKGFGLSFGAIEEAGIIISDTPDKCLAHLKQGKQVVQFIYWRQIPAEGLLETYPDQFRIFRILFDEDDKNNVIAMLTYISSLSTGERKDQP